MNAPANMTNSEYTNTINAYREWEWEGFEPLNKRLMRFVGVAELNKQYSVDFAGAVPTNLYHKIQQREHETNNKKEWMAI